MMPRRTRCYSCHDSSPSLLVDILNPICGHCSGFLAPDQILKLMWEHRHYSVLIPNTTPDHYDFSSRASRAVRTEIGDSFSGGDLVDVVLISQEPHPIGMDFTTLHKWTNIITGLLAEIGHPFTNSLTIEQQQASPSSTRIIIRKVQPNEAPYAL